LILRDTILDYLKQHNIFAKFHDDILVVYNNQIYNSQSSFTILIKGITNKDTIAYYNSMMEKECAFDPSDPNFFTTLINAIKHIQK